VSDTIRRAELADLPAMIALRTEAEQWLRQQGITQWTSDYFDYARNVMTASVEAGIAWVVEHDDEVVATASLSPDADMDFWTIADVPDSALYLGKMIVARQYAGRGFGDGILDWASNRARILGRNWLRIDVRRDNARLQAYYLNRGFVHVRTVRPALRRTESGWLAQRPAGQTCDGLPLRDLA
jgi:GNAT superfamily N-acetyltransferase